MPRPIFEGKAWSLPLRISALLTNIRLCWKTLPRVLFCMFNGDKEKGYIALIKNNSSITLITGVNVIKLYIILY